METIRTSTVPGSATVEATWSNNVYKKITWRIMPLFFLCYVVAFMDRVNVGFAKLQMLSDLNFSEAVYGFGAGIFFIGYFLFEVPSNIMMHKFFGARKWIARIMITWGLLSAAMAFVHTATTFYLIRFFLGVAEAGFFPRRTALFYVLVSGTQARQGHRDFCNVGTNSGDHWRTHLRMDSP